MAATSVARYRLDVFRGRHSGLRLATSDPRIMADEYEALRHVASRAWRIEVRDMHEGREGSIVSYEELRRRQRRPRHGNYLAATDQRAEASDRRLAKLIARWACRPSQRLPNTRGLHDWTRVRQHAYEFTRNEDVYGIDLDRALDRIDAAIRQLA